MGMGVTMGVNDWGEEKDKIPGEKEVKQPRAGDVEKII